jgi:hypothetical protein
MGQHVLGATTKVYSGIEEDELKLYVHCEYPGALWDTRRATIG